MTEYYYPERMGRVILLAMEEVLGHDGAKAILQLASLGAYLDHYPTGSADKTFSFTDLGRLNEALDQAFGPQGGHGTAMRIGRACFQYGLREYGMQLGVTQI